MKNRRNHYRILHVDRDAPAEVIHASYRTLMHRLRIHPDLGGDEAEAALVNEAFATLSDPVKRAAYDRMLEPASAARPGRTARRTPVPARPSPPPNATVCSFCAAVSPGTDPARPEVTCTTCGSPLHPPPRHDAGDPSRRAMERLPRELPVAFRRAQSPSVVRRGATKDLSLNGMRLVSPIRLAIDERLLIDNSFCTAVAVVRSARPSVAPQGSGWEYGLEFLTLRFAHDRGGLISTIA
jgi:hypothetical protein